MNGRFNRSVVQNWILLINPPSTKKSIKTDRCQTDTRTFLMEFNFPPINLMYLSAIAKEHGYRTRVVDAPVEKRTTEEILHFFKKIHLKYLVLNISENPPEEEFALIPWCKKNNVPVIGIGYECTVNADKYLKNGLFNLILRKETELTFREFLSGIELSRILGLSYIQADKISHNKDRPFLQDLDILPRPDRLRSSLIYYISPMTGKPFTTIQVGKGCSYQCNFCLTPLFSGRREIYRSIGEIISEIQVCIEKLGITDFFLRADNFTADNRWVKAFCKHLLRSDLGKQITWYCNSRVDTLNPQLLAIMREAGCRLVTFGMESGSQRILNRMHKGLSIERCLEMFHTTRRIPLVTGIFFIIGYPSETTIDLEKSMQVSRKSNALFLQLESYHPYRREMGKKSVSVMSEKQYLAIKRRFIVKFYFRFKVMKEIIQKMIFWDVNIRGLLYRISNVFRIVWKWLFSQSF